MYGKNYDGYRTSSKNSELINMIDETYIYDLSLVQGLCCMNWWWGIFFGSRLIEKTRLMKNQQNIENTYSLFFNFLRPKLTLMGQPELKYER